MVYFITDFEEQNKSEQTEYNPHATATYYWKETDGSWWKRRVTGQKYIDGQVTDKCLTDDLTSDDKCPHSIGKDSR